MEVIKHVFIFLLTTGRSADVEYSIDFQLYAKQYSTTGLRCLCNPFYFQESNIACSRAIYLSTIELSTVMGTAPPNTMASLKRLKL